jgi:hypothetical protein
VARDLGICSSSAAARSTGRRGRPRRA